MYQLVRQQGEVRERTLEITFLEPGAEAYCVYIRLAMDDWVVVEVARNEPEAELLCSVLRDAGIECLARLTNSGAGAGDGLSGVGGHDVIVRPQD